MQPREMVVRFVVAVLFAGLLSTAPSVWAMDVVQAEKASAAIVERASANTCNWKTYTSETYGFEMKYPQHLAVQEEMPLAVIEGTVLGLLLVNCAYYDGTNLMEASLFVGVAPEKACSSGLPTGGPQDPSACADPAEQRDIAGVTFSKTSAWEGVVGNQYGLIMYSASQKVTATGLPYSSTP